MVELYTLSQHLKAKLHFSGGVVNNFFVISTGTSDVSLSICMVICQMIHVLKYSMLHFCDIVLKFFYICFNIFFIHGNTYFWLHGVFLYICFSIFPHVNSSSRNILQFSNHYPVIHIDFFISKIHIL